MGTLKYDALLRQPVCISAAHCNVIGIARPLHTCCDMQVAGLQCTVAEPSRSSAHLCHALSRLVSLGHRAAPLCGMGQAWHKLQLSSEGCSSGCRGPTAATRLASRTAALCPVAPSSPSPLTAAQWCSSARPACSARAAPTLQQSRLQKKVRVEMHRPGAAEVQRV